MNNLSHSFFNNITSITLHYINKSAETVFEISISSTSVFKLAKSYFTAKLDVSTPDASFKSSFVT